MTTNGLSPPDFVSSWTSITAYSNPEVTITHGFGEMPMKLDVFVRVTHPVHGTVTFPATGSGQTSDDPSKPFGGVIYLYNTNSVKIMAPGPSSCSPCSGGVAYFGIHLSVCPFVCLSLKFFTLRLSTDWHLYASTSLSLSLSLFLDPWNFDFTFLRLSFTQVFLYTVHRLTSIYSTFTGDSGFSGPSSTSGVIVSGEVMVRAWKTCTFVKPATISAAYPLSNAGSMYQSNGETCLF